MAKNWVQLLANTLTIFAAAFAYPIVDVKAQNITLDGSLGKTETLTGPNYSIPQSVGQTAGDNLFHSFGKFNLDTNEAAIFESADNIRNIFSRVTGGSISNIDGLIKANGTANLFLINPSGIVFGENARLDIGGSFVATTADSILFGDRFEFSATNPQDKPLLTVNLPLGLQYGQNPGGITVKGNGEKRDTTEAFDPKSGLKVPTDKTLAFLGGDVLLKGAVLKAESGRIELGSVSSEGTVDIQPVENGFAFGFDEVENFGDIQLSQNTAVDASGDGAGDIRVTGKNLTIKDNSVITSTQTGTKESGNIIVNATDQVELNETDNSSFVSGLHANNVSAEKTAVGGDINIKTPLLRLLNGATVTTNIWGTGNSGNINIEANKLIIEGGAKVAAMTHKTGNGGNVIVNVKDVRIIGTGNNGNTPSSLVVSAEKDSTTNANAGDLNITANNLLVKDGAFISATTSGEGNGGNMKINATSKIEITGQGGNENQYPSGLFVTAEKPENSEKTPTGNSGSLDITTKQMLVENGAFVSASNNAGGSAGRLNIETDELLLKNNVRFFVGRVTENQDVGDLNIKTDTLLVEEGSSMQAGTSGVGGNLNIKAKDIQVIGTGNDGNTPSRLTVSAKRSRTGDGGKLNIETERITIKDGAYLSTNPSGTGNGGNLDIKAKEYVHVIGKGGNNPKENNQPYLSGLFGSAEPGSTGDAGNVDIETKEMLVKDGAFVSTKTETQGNGGNLSIKATNLRVVGGASLDSGTSNKGKGGNLNIEADDLQIIGTGNNGNTPSSLSASASVNSSSDAGNVDIKAKRMVVKDGAFVATTTKGSGNGGSLNIDSEDLQIVGQGGIKSGDLPYSSGLFSSADRESKAEKAGDLTITAQRVLVKDKAEVGAGTSSSANAGNLTINTSSLQVQNESSIVSKTLSEDKDAGNGGNVKVDADTLQIEDNSEISVASQKTGIPGNIIINSPEITLDNKGKFSAESASGNGGNINLDVSELLRMHHGSEISTNGGTEQQEGDGGNININSKFIVAVPKENSDITTDAFSGKGGQIKIKTSGIFGIFPKDEPTDFSDITASSELGINGEININQVDVDPAKGLIELPENLVDATQEISQSCTPSEIQKGSSFVYVGRGGLPVSPNEPLQEFELITSWVSLPLQTSSSREDKLPVSSVSKNTRKIIEAQKIVVDKNGDTFLVAESPQNFKSPFISSCSQ